MPVPSALLLEGLVRGRVRLRLTVRVGVRARVRARFRVIVLGLRVTEPISRCRRMRASPG